MGGILLKKIITYRWELKHYRVCVENTKSSALFFSLTQFIKYPTRIICNSSSLLDHVLTNTPEKVRQSGIIDTSISDHLLIYCTRKIWKDTVNDHKYIKQRSFKNSNSRTFVDQLQLIEFPNYERFHDTELAYGGFMKKLIKGSIPLLL